MIDVDTKFFNLHAFQLSAVLPSNFTGQVLTGGKVMAAIGPSGKIIFQEIASSGFRIQYCIFNFLRPFTLVFKSENAVLQSCYSYQEDIQLQFQNQHPIKIPQDEFILLHNPRTEGSAHFENGKEYRFMGISYGENWVRELETCYPPLRHFLDSAPGRESFIVARSQWQEPEAREILLQLFESRFEASLRQYYLDLKIKEYMTLLVYRNFQERTGAINLTEIEIGRLREVAHFLLEQKNQFYPTSRLAKMALMNEQKFKTGFKFIMNKSPFEYQREGRLKEALRLLTKTDMRVNDIFPLVGYKRISSFVSEFRKFFGYPPGSVRRKR